MTLILSQKTFLLLRCLLCLFPLLFTNCSFVSHSVPTKGQFKSKAHSKKEQRQLQFPLIHMTPKIADILAAQQPALISTLDKTPLRATHNDRIGAGDMLDITLFELGKSLFGAGDGTHITAHSLPPTQVEADGTIMIPYVGRMHVGGLTPSMVARLIEYNLRGKSQNPQVMVNIKNDIANTVIVSGEARRPGRVVLSLANERLSDVVAISGGSSYPPKDTLIELVRNNKIGATDLATLENEPQEDIIADPGDRVRVIYQPRVFTAFGAVGQTQQRNEIQFGTMNLSLASALSRVGGPSDMRANPKGVFLLRYEDRVITDQIGVKPPFPTAQKVPIIYQIDMMDPIQYLIAQRIPMKNRDSLVFTDAPADNFYKFVTLFNSILGEIMSAGLYAVR